MFVQIGPESRVASCREEVGMEQTTHKRRLELSGSTLKIIAMVTMLIDHIGAAVLVRYLLVMQSHIGGILADHPLFILYRVLRGIGRISFPIYCFLLVEGFQKTRNLKKYILRLGIFAVIAEVPFDLCFSARVVCLEHQSVMLTLLLGVITMWGVSLLEARVKDRRLLVPCAAAVIAAGAVGAELLRTDYGYMGVACIMVLYVLRRVKWMQMLGGCLIFLWEIWAPIAFLPIACYNGRKGLQLKYVFYLFYPLHLLLLYLICVRMGTGYIPVI